MAVGLSFALAQIGIAQETKREMPTFDLGEIVVTSTRIETQVKNVPNKVTIIDSQMIETLSPKNVDNILRNVCGVDILRRTGLTSSTSTVTLRGMSGNVRGRTLVLLDGIPLNEPYGSEVYWNSISIKDIERIEIVPGATSSLYGPGAMGGVINIITKRPERLENELDLGYGDFATRSFNLSHSNRLDKFSYRISGAGFKTNGYVAALNRRVYDIRRSKENYNVNLKLLYDFDETSSIGMDFRHYEEDVNGGRRYYYGSKDLDNFSLNFKKEINDIRYFSTLYFSWDDLSWTYDKYPSYTSVDYVNNSPRRGVGGSFQINIPFADIHTLSLGTDLRWGKIVTKDEYQSVVRRVQTQGKQQLIGFYLQDEIKLFQKFIINLGARYDWWESLDGYLYDDNLSPKETNYSDRKDSAISPKLGFAYHLNDNTTLRSSIGKAFRTPTLYDLYRTWGYGSTTYRSNPNLDPERMYSYEVGIDQTIGNDFLGRLTFYYNDVKDLIYSVDIGGGIKEKQNVGKVEIKGLETELRYNIMKDWSLFGNYTYNSSKLKEHTDKTLEGKSLTYTPKHKCSLGISFHNPKLINIDLVGRYVGSVFHNDSNSIKLKGHFIWDLSFVKAINEDFEISLKIENLQDRNYQEYRNYLAPPRTITGSLRYKF